MKMIFSNWSVMRWIRLVLGSIALVQAFMLGDSMLGLLGGFLLFTAIANVGCCGGGGCTINSKASMGNKKDEYEEVDSIK